MAFARFNGIEIDIAPRTADFDHQKGSLGHVCDFEREPERHNDLVRLLKGWARTHVKVLGILVEVVAKEVQNIDSGNLLRGFLTALTLLQEDRPWVDPLDTDNESQISQFKWK